MAAIALVAGTIGHAEAAKRGKTAKQPTVTISGCAYAAPPACTNMWSGGQIYSLSGGKPPVPVNVGVTIVGVQSGDISVCFGVPIKVLKWSRNRMVCPKQ
ncbi:MAG TPA: hypothetical protein VIV09_04435 [Pseudolabrys sp.]